MDAWGFTTTYPRFTNFALIGALDEIRPPPMTDKRVRPKFRKGDIIDSIINLGLVGQLPSSERAGGDDSHTASTASDCHPGLLRFV